MYGMVRIYEYTDSIEIPNEFLKMIIAVLFKEGMNAD